MPNDTDFDVLAQCALDDVVRVRPVLDKIADKWTTMILPVLRQAGALQCHRAPARRHHP